MTAVWPADLPPPAAGTWKEAPPKNSIKSDTDKGPGKLRRRTTANVRPATFDLALTKDEATILDDFHVIDTYSGSERFYFTHPRTGVVHLAQFADEPNINHVDGDEWRASVNLELWPA